MTDCFRRARVVVALLAVAACGGSDSSDPTPNTTLAVSPSGLTFSDTAVSRSFFLTTQPAGGRLDWQVTAKPPWLTVEPSSGVIRGAIVTVNVQANGLATSDPGTLSGKSSSFRMAGRHRSRSLP